MKPAEARPSDMQQVAMESMGDVGRELARTIEEAQKRLEAYLERPDNVDALMECGNVLHQVRGVLNVVELYGAAQLADEMQRVCEFLGSSQARPRGDALEVLSRALVQLPTYLERLIGGARDIPIVLLPLLNDLRSVRGARLLNENTLFLHNLSRSSPPPEVLTRKAESRPLVELSRELRPRFQAALLGWITGNAPADQIKVLLAISIEFEEASAEPSVHRLWRVVSALLEALREDGLEAGASVKRLLGQVDRQIKRVIDEGEAALAAAPPDELVNNVLYYIGRARKGGRRVREVKRAFDLEKLLPSDDEVDRERVGLAGPSPDLMRTVGAAIKDDLGQVKDGLDIFLRLGDKEAQALEQQRTLLKKIGDTLGMLGLGHLRRDVERENSRLGEIVASPPADLESPLMDIAATLLHLEDHLDKELVRLVDPSREPQPAAGDDEDVDFRAVAEAVIGECMVNLAKVKEAIVNYVSHPEDSNTLEPVAKLMRGIRAAMLLLEKERVSDLVERIGDYVQHHIRFAGKAPSSKQVDRIADAIVSLEYYMETIRAGRADPWYMLDNAETNMKALRRADTLPDFEPPEEDTVSVTQIYEGGSRTDQHVSTTKVGFAPTQVVRPETTRYPVFEETERSDPEFLELFIEEAKEESDAIRDQFRRWKSNPADQEALHTLRRSFHTLKGSGRMVGAQLIGEFGWSQENLINRLIDGTVKLSDDVVQTLEAAATVVPELIEQLEVGTEPDHDIDALMSAAWELAEATPSETTELVEALSEDQATAPEEVEASAATEGQAPEILEPAIQMDAALLEIFTKETASHLQTLRAYAEACEEREAPYALNDDVRRAMHTLHGSANMASVDPIVALAEPLDHFVSERFNSGQRIPVAAIGVLEDTATAIEELVAQINQPGELPDHESLRERIALLLEEASEPEVPTEGLEVGEFEIDETLSDSDTIVTEAVETEEVAAAGYDTEIAGIFADEAGELLDNAETDLHDMQWGENAADAFDDLQRQLHTLKGGARMAGIAAMGDLSHELESLLSREQLSEAASGPALASLVQKTLDSLHKMRELIIEGAPVAGDPELLDEIRNWRAPATELEAGQAVVQEEEQPAGGIDLSEFDIPTTPVAGTPPGEAIETWPSVASAAEPVEETDEELREPLVEPVRAGFAAPDYLVPPQQSGERPARARVDAELLQTLLDNAGEISIFRSRLEQQVNSVGFNLAELSRTVTRLRDQLRKLEIETEAQILHRHQAEEGPARGDFDPLELDRYSNIQQLSRSLAETTGDLMSIQELLDRLVKESDNLLVQQSRVTSELQHGLMRTRMVPFQSNAQRLGRVVRQTADEAGKNVELHIEGGQGEMDRQMLERLMPALEHMLRNAVIHGIESQDQRARAGKPDVGQITIRLKREGADTVVELRDDGRGLDLQQIRARGIEAGLLGADEEHSEAEIMQLVFEPGLTTATEVTQTAGRGVGMDVVANEVRKLGGSVQIESQAGQGTRFILRLPFTLAISQALLVKTGDETYALPLTTVEGVTRIARADLEQRLASDSPTLEYGGRDYPLQYLGALLGNPAVHLVEEHVAIPVVLVRAGEQSAALITDDMLGGREIVVKSVGPHLAAIRGISGATILGDGSTVLILDLGALIRSGAAAGVAELAEEVDRRTFVLVVDDSITVRRVTQRLLERNGMRVMTAKDGVDAVTTMQEHKPDVILLDIEMPRMDGYEVAAHVRDDPRLKDVPIVMITSRVGLKHRARAIELGVNDYLGKPYQESQLLDAIEPLVNRKVQ